MRVLRRVLVAAAGAAGVAAAYTIGAVVHGGPKPEAAAVVAGEPAVKVPDAVAPPTVLPDVNLPNPTGVLLGEVKVPDDLLKPPEPPARPDLIVPDLKK